MIAIRNYNDTKKELNIAEIRLGLLKNKKEEIYIKYFGNNFRLKEVNIQQSRKNNDPVLEYLQELNCKNEDTNLSLEEEIQEQLNAVNKLRYYIKLMDYNLKIMDNTECLLYYAIVVDGLSISKAIDVVSEEVGKDPRTIWKYHYPKVEEEIKKLKIK